MKRQFSFLWVAFAILTTLPGCGPYIPTNAAPGSALVMIECQEASLRQILELLRLERGKDISVVAGGSFQEVTAAFRPEDTPPGKLAEIVKNLNDMSGVLHVEVMENPRPILQNF